MGVAAFAAGWALGKYLLAEFPAVQDWADSVAALFLVLFDRIGDYMGDAFDAWIAGWEWVGEKIVNILHAVILTPIAFWKDSLMGFMEWWLENSKNMLGKAAPEWMKNALKTVHELKVKSEKDLADSYARDNKSNADVHLYDKLAAIAARASSRESILELTGKLNAAMIKNREAEKAAKTADKAAGAGAWAEEDSWSDTSPSFRGKPSLTFQARQYTGANIQGSVEAYRLQSTRYDMVSSQVALLSAAQDTAANTKNINDSVQDGFDGLDIATE
jgi:hypothetical protein